MTIRLFSLITIGVLVLSSFPAAHAGDAPVVGRYRVRFDSAPAEQVDVTVRLRLFNPSTVDVQDLRLLFADTIDSREIPGSVSKVSVPARGVVDVEARLVIPRFEYDLWSSGAPPKLFVGGSPESGTPRPLRVELVPDNTLEFGLGGAVGADGPVEIQRQMSTEGDRP